MRDGDTSAQRSRPHLFASPQGAKNDRWIERIVTREMIRGQLQDSSAARCVDAEEDRLGA